MAKASNAEVEGGGWKVGAHELREVREQRRLEGQESRLVTLPGMGRGSDLNVPKDSLCCVCEFRADAGRLEKEPCSKPGVDEVLMENESNGDDIQLIKFADGDWRSGSKEGRKSLEFC